MGRWADDTGSGSTAVTTRRRGALPHLRPVADDDARGLGFNAARLRRRIRCRSPVDKHRGSHLTQRHDHAGDGGTRTVSPTSTPATAATHDLRYVAAGVGPDRGLLPGAA